MNLNGIQEHSPIHEFFKLLTLTEEEAKNWQEIRLYLQKQAIKKRLYIDLQKVF